MSMHKHVMTNNNYCNTCGTKLITSKSDDSASPYCAICEKPIYQDPKVATCTLITNEKNAVLLTKRALEPGVGKWALPGGYVNRGEVVEKAAQREVFEETGLLCKITQLLGVFSVENSSPILIAYRAQAVGGNLTPSTETPEVAFFIPSDLPPLAFPRDGDIIRDACLNT